MYRGCIYYSVLLYFLVGSPLSLASDELDAWQSSHSSLEHRKSELLHIERGVTPIDYWRPPALLRFERATDANDVARHRLELAQSFYAIDLVTTMPSLPDVTGVNASFVSGQLRIRPLIPYVGVILDGGAGYSESSPKGSTIRYGAGAEIGFPISRLVTKFQYFPKEAHKTDASDLSGNTYQISSDRFGLRLAYLGYRRFAGVQINYVSPKNIELKSRSNIPGAILPITKVDPYVEVGIVLNIASEIFESKKSMFGPRREPTRY